MQMMVIEYLYAKYTDDDGLDDDVTRCWFNSDELKKPLSWVKFEHLRDKIAVVRKDLPRKGE